MLSVHQECLDLAHDVAITRRPLHGARLALHVHETHRTLGGGRRLQRPRLLERSDVVDQTGARGGGGAHDFRLAGIYGDDDRGLRSQPLDDREDAAQLLFSADVGGTGSR